jgi:Family of unknown function (DUF6492)
MAAVDVVIPAHEKDFPVLKMAVRAALRHVEPIRRLHVVSAQRFDYPGDRVRWVPEPELPELPTLPDVRERWAESNAATASRAPWVYQQLLKLGAGSYIGDLTPSYLVIDADVIFLRPVSFDPDAIGRFPFSKAFEHHLPYRDAYARLFGSAPGSVFSLTAHHMLYDRALVGELQAELEQRHGVPWYWAYVDAVDKAEVASISEMDVYGWWVMDRHPGVAGERQLSWRDVRVPPGILGRAALSPDYDFVAAHAWYRQGRVQRYRGAPLRVAAEVKARVSSPGPAERP